MSIGNDNIARIYAFLGSSGCGKSTEIRKRIKTPKRKRVIVWSPKEEIDAYALFWPDAVVMHSVREVIAAVARGGGFHIVFKPSMIRKTAEKQFDLICRLYVARNISYIMEELHTVTRGSWAPDGWSELVMMGRGFGAEIFGCSQRPASIDKDFLGNCSSVRTGRLSYPEDQKAVAKALGVPLGSVNALSGYEWIERNMNDGKVTASNPAKAIVGAASAA